MAKLHGGSSSMLMERHTELRGKLQRAGTEPLCVPPLLAAGNELCERLAYYGLATNLVVYLTIEMRDNPASSAILV